MTSLVDRGQHPLAKAVTNSHTCCWARHVLQLLGETMETRMSSPEVLQRSLEQHAARTQRWALHAAGWEMLRWDHLVLREASALGRTGTPLIPALWGTGRSRPRAPGQEVTAELPAMVRLRRAGHRGSNPAMRHRELTVVLLSPLQQKPTKAALNSYQSTMSFEQ